MNNSHSDFSSAAYWENRYRKGGNSGAGSYGRLAVFKADFLNNFFRSNSIKSVLEFGCGDGNQLGLLEIEHYIGYDVSSSAVARCRETYGDRVGLSFYSLEDTADLGQHDVTLSLDVLFHLVEIEVFSAYLERLFRHSNRHVIIYSSDFDAPWPHEHVRHRKVTNFVKEYFQDWHLNCIVPNAYPYRGDSVDDTSFCDFLVYSRKGISCKVTCPAGSVAQKG